MYSRIIVPLDGSPLAEEALPEAIRLARLAGAPLHLVHVIDPTQLPWYGTFGMDMDIETAKSALDEEARQSGSYLGGVMARLEAEGLAVTFEQRRGRVTRELMTVAQPGELIVMASHGRGGISRWLLGSVAEDLLRHATVPILLVKAGGGKDSGRPHTGAQATTAPA
jgi:nucleotide-binding universal stress UspA family protein